MTRHTETNIEQYEFLVRCLKNDWGIKATWDGLRQFWHVERDEETTYTLEEHIEQLEQLCNDLFDHVCAEQIGARVNMQQFVELSERMDALGLLEEQ